MCEKYESFVIQMLYVRVLCASCGSSQCFVLHDFPFVNEGRGYKRRPYRRGILQSWSHDCLIGSHECLFVEVYVLVLRCCECVSVLGLKYGSEPLGALPLGVQCLF